MGPQSGNGKGGSCRRALAGSTVREGPQQPLRQRVERAPDSVRNALLHERFQAALFRKNVPLPFPKQKGRLAAGPVDQSDCLDRPWNLPIPELLLRACAKITWHFRIPSLAHLRPILNRKILEIVGLLLRFCSIGSTKSGPNLGANSVNLFLRRP